LLGKVPCSELAVATHIEMLKDTSSLWLCWACLPNLMKYLPTTDAIDKSKVKVELMSVNDRVSKFLESGRLAVAQHSANLRVLEVKLSESIKQIARSASLQVLRRSGAERMDRAPLKNRAENHNRLIITNLPVTDEGRLIDRIITLARHIGVDLCYNDIDHCNQMTSAHPSAVVPVTFVRKWQRDSFYSHYRHFVKERQLAVWDVFRQSRSDCRRIYLFEHLKPADNVVYKETRRMKKRSLVAGSVHEELFGVCSFV
jgi:hypothetical protein